MGERVSPPWDEAIPPDKLGESVMLEVFAMARWDPWSDLFNLQSEMARWANDALGNGSYLSAVSDGDRGARPSMPVTYLPLDIRQRDGEFVIEASVPGLSPDEVEITADQGVLTIRGQRKARGDEQSEGTYLRRERSAYTLVRQLTLPSDVKEDQISASFQNGVLTVRIPRVAAPAPRRIPLASGDRQDEPQVIEAGTSRE